MCNLHLACEQSRANCTSISARLNCYRQVIQIDEDKCNGCGICVNACHESALGIVDGKAKLHRIAMCMCSVGEEGANEKINNILCEALFMIGYAKNPEMLLPTIKKIDEISEDGYGI